MLKVLTIDGPSGSGKGTVAKILAQKLEWDLLDSGALYRLVAYGALKHGIELDDEQSLSELALNLDVEFRLEEGSELLIPVFEGEDVSKKIRTETCGDAASKVAALTPVRDALLDRQRAFATEAGLIADGRDMGTVVFPDAPVKVYLSASAEERAERRYNQLKSSGESVSIAAILDEIKARDARDMNREVAPLKPAADAIEIDSTHLSIDEVVNQVSDALSKVGLI
ncbi:(d)CMP kinase [Litoribrevibacter albus]|uniref:Cytidylate kinase n=1 Tax=Litoribrevibacter albus TaxID=1473156 RepID=A0AA37W5Q2_9GAMM|nr:(d)CMP kinase [Litoribrevibacter albus]GLQ30760.1 cytidylate kinase [Litoribrevibacter albus]